MLSRTSAVELADLEPSDIQEFNQSVYYFKKSNRLLFNYALIYKYLKIFLDEKKSNNILDVGTGVADLPVFLAKKLGQKRISYCITGIDKNPQVINLAKKETQKYKHINLICSTTEGLPGSYDVIIASQVFHHFSPMEALSFLQTAKQKASRAIIISDLIRNKFVYWLVKFFVAFTTFNKINRHDGAISVLRCYNDGELKELFAKSGITNFKIYNLVFRKIVVIRLS